MKNTMVTPSATFDRMPSPTAQKSAQGDEARHGGLTPLMKGSSTPLHSRVERQPQPDHQRQRGADRKGQHRLQERDAEMAVDRAGDGPMHESARPPPHGAAEPKKNRVICRAMNHLPKSQDRREGGTAAGGRARRGFAGLTRPRPCCARERLRSTWVLQRLTRCASGAARHSAACGRSRSRRADVICRSRNSAMGRV